MDFTWLFLQMLFSLALVSGAAVFILRYVLPKMTLGKKWQNNPHFEILSRFALEHRKTLYLVRAGEKVLVLGAAEQSLNLLTELPKNEIGKIEHETKN